MAGATTSAASSAAASSQPELSEDSGSMPLSFHRVLIQGDWFLCRVRITIRTYILLTLGHMFFFSSCVFGLIQRDGILPGRKWRATGASGAVAG